MLYFLLFLNVLSVCAACYRFYWLLSVSVSAVVAAIVFWLLGHVAQAVAGVGAPLWPM